MAADYGLCLKKNFLKIFKLCLRKNFILGLAIHCYICDSTINAKCNNLSDKTIKSEVN